jgi:hypothetical protein
VTTGTDGERGRDLGLAEQIKESEVGGACSTSGRGQKIVKGFG